MAEIVFARYDTTALGSSIIESVDIVLGRAELVALFNEIFDSEDPKVRRVYDTIRDFLLEFSTRPAKYAHVIRRADSTKEEHVLGLYDDMEEAKAALLQRFADLPVDIRTDSESRFTGELRFLDVVATVERIDGPGDEFTWEDRLNHEALQRSDGKFGFWLRDSRFEVYDISTGRCLQWACSPNGAEDMVKELGHR